MAARYSVTALFCISRGELHDAVFGKVAGILGGPY
jgi:hypothetical protein